MIFSDIHIVSQIPFIDWWCILNENGSIGLIAFMSDA